MMRMRALTVVVCLLAGVTEAAAQDRVQGGILAGPSAASLRVTGDGGAPDFTSRPGFSAGLFVVREVRPGFAIEPEALFTLKGGKATDGSLENDFRLTGIEIPLLARFQSTGSSAASFHVVAGPVVGFRLTAKQKITSPSGSTTVDVKDESRAGELGLAIGAGVTVRRFRLDGRYTWGLSRLDKDETDGFDFKSRVFAVLLGISVF